MGFYDEMADIATELLGEFQQGSVQLVRSVSAPSDPSTPWQPGDPTLATYDLAAAVRGVSQRYVDGTTILSSDQQVTCAVPPVTPDMTTDTLLIDGIAVTVLKNMPIPASGTPVAYLFVVRR